jgi:lysophospholipase L1-like esterase
MKLCYIDIRGDTDAKKLANDYMATLDRLSSKYPHVTFVAMTSPLTTLQTGPKAWVKRLLGRTPSGYLENYRRLEFNDILRDKYEKQGRLFDLAKFEAIGGNNYLYQGRSVETMNPELTSDGGHLNSLGEKVIAAKLIKYIADLYLSRPN